MMNRPTSKRIITSIQSIKKGDPKAAFCKEKWRGIMKGKILKEKPKRNLNLAPRLSLARGLNFPEADVFHF